MEPAPMQSLVYTVADAREDLRQLEDPAAFGGNPTIRTAIWSMASHTIRQAKIVRLQPHPHASAVSQFETARQRVAA